VGRYTENIVDMLPISIYWYWYRYRYHICTVDNRFFRYIEMVDIVSVTSEISVIFRYVTILFPIFNVNLKTDKHVSKTEYLIWQHESRYTSLLMRCNDVSYCPI